MPDEIAPIDDLAAFDAAVASAHAAPKEDAVADEVKEDAEVVEATEDKAVAKEGDDDAATDDKDVSGKDKLPADGDKDKSVEDSAEDDGIEPTTVASLKSLIADNDELKKFVNAPENVKLKGTLFTYARRAERADQYDELFQTPEVAKSTAATAEQMLEFDRLYRSTKPEDNENFLRALFMNSFERDDTGKIKTDGNGNPLSDGSYHRFVKAYRTTVYDEFERVAKSYTKDEASRAKGEELLEVLRIFRETVEGTEEDASAEDTDTSKLPKAVREQLAELAKLKAEAQGKKTPDAIAQDTQEAIDKAIVEDAEALLKKALGARSKTITTYVHDNIIKDVLAKVKATATKNTMHNAQYLNALKKSDGSPEATARLVEFRRGYVKDFLPKTVGLVLSEASAAVVAKVTEKDSKVNKQIANSKEAATSNGGVARPSHPDVRSKVVEFESKAKAAGKSKISDMEALEAALS